MTTSETELTADWFAAHVDISCVQAYHTRKDIRTLAAIARRHGFVSAHVLPNRLAELRELLLGSAVLAGAPVGFPSGGATSATKLVEARQLLDEGVQELDIVVNIGRLKSGEIDYCIEDVGAVVELAAGRVPTRLILEVSRLTPDEICRGCDVAMGAGVDYVKTGTGWAGPTTLDAIRLISGYVGKRVAIKAAGGVRNLEDVRSMRELGVTRFGINDETAVSLIRTLAEPAA